MARRLSIVALWLAGVAISVTVIARTHISTDMSAFLPRSPNTGQRILVDQLREGVVSRMILLAVEGADADTLAAVSHAMGGHLARRTWFRRRQQWRDRRAGQGPRNPLAQSLLAQPRCHARTFFPHPPCTRRWRTTWRC